ncbi:MAG: GrpB family protein [Pseudomonadota bacterium]
MDQPERVTVVAFDPRWADAFAREAAEIRDALAPLAITLHHMGSTAVPGLAAKPIIDMLGEVSDLGALDLRRSALTRLGYEALGAFGIPGRRYFRKRDRAGARSHHLHVFREGSPDVTRHLAFVAYLTAHPAMARAYGDLKQRLAREGADWERYIAGKSRMVAQIEADALAWRAANPGD